MSSSPETSIVRASAPPTLWICSGPLGWAASEPADRWRRASGERGCGACAWAASPSSGTTWLRIRRSRSARRTGTRRSRSPLRRGTASRLRARSSEPANDGHRHVEPPCWSTRDQGPGQRKEGSGPSTSHTTPSRGATLIVVPGRSTPVRAECPPPGSTSRPPNRDPVNANRRWYGPPSAARCPVPRVLEHSEETAERVAKAPFQNTRSDATRCPTSAPDPRSRAPPGASSKCRVSQLQPSLGAMARSPGGWTTWRSRTHGAGFIDVVLGHLPMATLPYEGTGATHR